MSWSDCGEDRARATGQRYIRLSEQYEVPRIHRKDKAIAQSSVGRGRDGLYKREELALILSGQTLAGARLCTSRQLARERAYLVLGLKLWDHTWAGPTCLGLKVGRDESSSCSCEPSNFSLGR